jgi:hypothetical protein
LQWKTNRAAGSATIAAGAGPVPAASLNYSPTRLSALLLPASAAPSSTVSTGQFSLFDSDGTTWQTLTNGSTPMAVTITPTLTCQAIIGGNADLWTKNAGLNQDLGIVLVPSNATGNVIAWKESGGYAGTNSPNAAYVQAVAQLHAGTTYTIKLVWKANHSAVGTTIFAGAGAWPAGSGLFSPTRLTVQLAACA